MSRNRSPGRSKCKRNAISTNSCKPQYTLPVAPVIPRRILSVAPSIQRYSISGRSRLATCQLANLASAAKRLRWFNGCDKMNRTVAGSRNNFGPIPAPCPIEDDAARITTLSAISDQIREALLGAPEIGDAEPQKERDDGQAQKEL